MSDASALHRGWTGLEMVKSRLGLAVRHLPEGRLVPSSKPEVCAPHSGGGDSSSLASPLLDALGK